MLDVSTGQQQFRQLKLILGRPEVCVCVRDDGCAAAVSGRGRPEEGFCGAGRILWGGGCGKKATRGVCVCVCVREGFCALSIECSVMSGEWRGRVCEHFGETGEAVEQ